MGSDLIAGEVDGPKVFILRSLLSDKLRSFVKSGPTELSQALVMVVLPLIALAGGKLSEGKLHTISSSEIHS